MNERQEAIKTFYNDLRIPDFQSKESNYESLCSFVNDAKHNPELIAERIGWMLAGHYGQGAYLMSWIMIESDSKSLEWIINAIARLEWMVPNRLVPMFWSSLNKQEQVLLRWYCGKEIEKSKRDRYGQV